MEKTVSGATRTKHSDEIYYQKTNCKPGRIIRSMSREEYEFEKWRKRYSYLDDELAKERWEKVKHYRLG